MIGLIKYLCTMIVLVTSTLFILDRNVFTASHICFGYIAVAIIDAIGYIGIDIIQIIIKIKNATI